MDPQRPDELRASPTSATTSVQSRERDANSADTAAALPTVSAVPGGERDSQGWLPRAAMDLPGRYFESLPGEPGESLPSMSSNSYARLYASPGPDENRRAALSYFPLVALAFLFDKRRSPYLRFHAAQGLALTLVAVALAVAHWLIFSALDSVPSLGMVFVEIALTWLFALVCVALAGLWLWGIVAAFIGKDPSLPLIRRLAERILAGAFARAS